MNSVHKKLDLRLILVFDAVYQDQSVSRAAERLGLSQPAVSHALTRMRSALGDELFVKSGRGMAPTSRAERLHASFQQALSIIRDTLSEEERFDPIGSERTFRLLMSDIGEAVYLPPLMARLKSAAPKIEVHVLQLPREQFAKALNSGAADLALGYLGHNDTGIMSQALFEDHFVCVASRRHPIIKRRLSLENYLASRHILVSRRGFSDGMVAKVLSEMQARRRIALRVPHFLSVPFIVSKSDLIVTVPSHLSSLYTTTGQLVSYPLPFEVPRLQLRLHWHKRFANDPGIAWFRRLLEDLFGARNAPD